MKSNASCSISKILVIFIALSSGILVSCSEKVYPAYAKQLERIDSSKTEYYNPGKHGVIQSPYIDKHKLKMNNTDSAVNF